MLEKDPLQLGGKALETIFEFGSYVRFSTVLMGEIWYRGYVTEEGTDIKWLRFVVHCRFVAMVCMGLNGMNGWDLP